MIMQRRSLIAGLGGLILAPSVVRASSLMPISTRLMRFTKADMLAAPFGYGAYEAARFPIKLKTHACLIIGAKVSPLNDSEMLLLSGSGEVVSAPMNRQRDLQKFVDMRRRGHPLRMAVEGYTQTRLWMDCRDGPSIQSWMLHKGESRIAMEVMITSEATS